MTNNAYVGLALSDGSVSYITVQQDGMFEITGMKLKNFYKSEEQVTALLALGNLRTLGSTPHGQWIPESSSYDKVHCCAFIRDLGYKPKMCAAQKTQSPESFFLLDGWSYLFENGKWILGYQGSLYTISQPGFMVLELGAGRQDAVPVPGDLKIYRIDGNGYPEQLHGFLNGWDTWKSMEQKAVKKAEEEHENIYLFRKNRLIRIIHPKTSKS